MGEAEVDLKHYRYFVAVAESKSLLAAADKLAISQPALSNRMKEIENAFGTPLFHRHSRGVRLTEAGEKLLPYAREILSAVIRAEHALKLPSLAADQISIGATPTPGVTFVPQLLDQCRLRYPKLRVLVQQGSSVDLLTLLSNGVLDAVLCYVRAPTKNAIPLCTEDMFLVGSPELLVGARKDIAFRDLYRYPLVLDYRNHISRRILNEASRGEHLKLDVRDEVEPVNLKRMIIIQQKRCSIVPYGLFSEEIRSGQMTARRIVSPSIALTLKLVLRPTLEPLVRDRLHDLANSIAMRGIQSGDFKWRKAVMPAANNLNARQSTRTLVT